MSPDLLNSCVTALSADGVGVCYGKFTAVESASFSLAEGELLALIGPNGHGKSSLVNAVAGLVGRTGTVTVFGKPLNKSDPAAAIQAGIVLVPERRHLYPALSVRDNILLGGFVRSRRRSAVKAWATVADVIEIFPELQARLDVKAGNLSGGQQQMVAIARALAARPRILLLDEPCLGLAESVSERVYELLQNLRGQGHGLLLVEENPLRALEVSTRAVELYRGRTVAPELMESATSMGDARDGGRVGDGRATRL